MQCEAPGLREYRRMTTITAAPDAPADAQGEHHHHQPVYGFTRFGQHVHAKTSDHLPDHNAYARFNKKFALLITNNIGTMSCFWLFCIVALIALPAVLVEAHILPSIGIIGATGFALCVAWLAQSFIQLVLLPALMVGQNLQTLAADARASKTFDDVEHIIDLLDCRTQGGIRVILEAIEHLRQADGLAPGAGAVSPEGPAAGA